jgi:Fur family transcriptional regulator, zinc uptake regulator
MAQAGKKSRTLFPRSSHNHSHCVSAALDVAVALCESEGHRLTPLRQRVLELVWSSHQPIGAYAILDQLKGDGRSAAPPTVYRALDFLLERGLVHRIESLNAFVGCPEPDADHPVQFLICRKCGTAAEMDDRRVADAIGKSAAERGFALEGRIIELSGLCMHCQSDKGRSGPRPHAD